MTSSGLAYTLCALTGIGILLSLILLIWHCVKIRRKSAVRFVTFSFAVLLVTYILCGLAIFLLVLQNDVVSDTLCHAAGFFILFSTLEALWMSAIVSLFLYLWKKEEISMKNTWTEYVPHKWSLQIYGLTIIVKAIFLGILSFLPLTDIQYFDSHSGYHFICVPLRLPHENGWGYSLFIIILAWITLAVTVFFLISVKLTSYRLQKLKQSNVNSTHYNKPTLNSETKFFTLKLSCALIITTTLWFLLMLLLSITFFSSGTVSSTENIQWTIGYLLCFVIILLPLSVILLNVITKLAIFKNWMDKKLIVKTFLHKQCPNVIENVKRIEAIDQGITSYAVKWRDKSGSLLPGTMKVFHPSVRQCWLAESSTVRRVMEHPNLATYHWESPENKFANVIEAFTGETHSPQSSLICYQHFPHGSLAQFLDEKVHRLTDIGLHKVTLDIASGLDYLHQHHLVHNALSTHTVYMASVSENIGLRAVLADFENCYEINRYDLTSYDLTSNTSSVFSIASSVSSILSHEEPSKHYSKDIKAFGLVVLEMLVAMGKYQKQKHYLTTDRNSDKNLNLHYHNQMKGAEKLDDFYAMETIKKEDHISSAFKATKRGEGEKSVEKHKRHKKCTCSQKVTDIRVCKPKNNPNIFNTAKKNAVVPSIDHCASGSNLDTSSSESLSNLSPDKIHRIQQRKLPPVPPQRHVSLENKEKSDSDDHSPQSTISSGISSESSAEDHYNVSSIGSRGSFDTIYEEEEQKCSQSDIVLSGNGRSAKRYAVKPAVVKRKQQKSKRNSSSFFDDSVVSSDSGMGSSHYDVESAMCPNSLERFSNAPGSRGTMYSTEKQNSYNIIMSYLDSPPDTDSAIDSEITSQHSAPPDIIVANHDDIVFLEDPEFDGLPDLRIRKKPCLGDHPHINGPCNHNIPFSSKPKPPIPVKPKFHKPMLQTAITKSSAEPIYEKIKMKEDSVQNDNVPKLLIDSCTNTGDSLKKRQPLLTNTDLIDNVQGKSLDVASIINMVQQADTHSVSSAPLPAQYVHNKSKHYRSNMSVNTEPSVISISSSVSSECCSKCGSNFKASESRQSLNSVGSGHSSRRAVQPKLGVTAFAVSRRQSQSSTHSSLQSVYVSPRSQTCKSGLDNIVHPLESTSICASIQSVDAKNIDRPNSARHLTPDIKKKLGPKLKSSARIEEVLQEVQREGNLGFTAGQLVPLLSECCLDHSSLSTERILKRLQQVLPTASV